MPLLKSCTECLEQTPRGSIAAISFCGLYPLGSLGNEHAREMRESLAKLVGETNPAAVLIDFTDLEYEWGDGICELVRPLRTTSKTLRPGCHLATRPFCLVATGKTAEALAPLVEPRFLLGTAGGKLFATRAEALSFLRSQIAMDGQ